MFPHLECGRLPAVLIFQNYHLEFLELVQCILHYAMAASTMQVIVYPIIFANAYVYGRPFFVLARHEMYLVSAHLSVTLRALSEALCPIRINIYCSLISL